MKRIMKGLIILPLLLSGCRKVEETKPTTLKVTNQFYYSRYNQEQKEAYDQIYQGILDYLPEINFSDSSLTPEQIASIGTCVGNDHPELFYIDRYSYYDWEKDSYMINYIYDQETTQEYTNQLNNLLEEYQSNITDKKGEELIQYVREYIMNSIEYDYNAHAIDKDLADMNNTEEKEAHTIIGGLLKGKCVCEGYSKIFTLLMNYAGYECELINGWTDGGGHVWNALLIDGKYYYYDLTWDDCNYDESKEDYHLYDHLTLEEISTDHYEPTFDPTSTDPFVNSAANG